MRRMRFFSLISLAMLVAGCNSQPTAAPTAVANPAATPEASAPAIQTSTVPQQTVPATSGQGCVATPAGTPYGTLRWASASAVYGATCEATVDTGELWVSFTLPKGVSEHTARSALQVSGPETPVVHFSPYAAGATLTLYFPPGRAGSTNVVQLSGPVGKEGAQATLGYRLKRAAASEVAASIRSETGTDWVPVHSGDTLPGEPLTLRLVAPNGVSGAKLAERVTQGLSKAAVSALVEQPDAQTVSIRLPSPRPRLVFDVTGLQAGTAMKGRDQALILNTGAPPYLAVVDPTTGNEQRVGGAPADVFLTTVSPDGRWAALMGLAPDALEQMVLWVADLRTGETRRTPLVVSHLFPAPVIWLNDRFIIPDLGMVQTYWLEGGRSEAVESLGAEWSLPSPDGRYLPGFVVDNSTEHPDYLAPASIVLHDLRTGQDRVYPNTATARLHQADSPPTLQLAWTPDGKGLLIRTESQGAGQQWLRLDVASGETSAYTGPTPPAATTGQLGITNGWTRGKWGPISLPGSKASFGEGLPVGVLPDGRLLVIRWERFGEIRPMPGP